MFQTKTREHDIELAVHQTGKNTQRSQMTDLRAFVVGSMNGLDTAVENIDVRWVVLRLSCGCTLLLRSGPLLAPPEKTYKTFRGGPHRCVC